MRVSSRSLVAVAALALLTTSLARADDALRWKFKQGDTLQYVSRSKSDVVVDASGVEFDISSGQTMDLTWKINKVNDDGSAEVSQRIDRLQLLINSPLTGEFRFDSKEAAKEGEEDKDNKQQAPGPGGQIAERFLPLLKSMIGQSFTMKISPRGEVTDIKLPEKMSEALKKQDSGNNGGGGSFFALLLGGGFSEDGIKQLIQRSVTLLPEKVPSSDTSWTQEFSSKLGKIGVQKNATKFSYEGVEEHDGKKLAKLSTDEEITLELNDNPDANFELEIAKQEAKGTIFFDNQTGRLAEANATAKVEMEGEFQGNDIYQERTTTTLVKQGTSADLPKEEKAATDASPGDEDQK